MKTILTRSGSVYKITGRSTKGLFVVSRNGDPKTFKAVAIFKDRLSAFEAAVKWGTSPDGRLEGFNKAGVRTCLLVMGQVRPGMILASATGLRSTEIVSVK